jgi:hypothetical protein
VRLHLEQRAAEALALGRRRAEACLQFACPDASVVAAMAALEV